MIRAAILLGCCVAAFAQRANSAYGGGGGFSGACGRPAVSPDSTWTAGSRIVGGEPAAFNSWPSQVALVQDNGEGYYPAQYCGGTIIDKQWILTAGHCVADTPDEEIIERHKVVVGGSAGGLGKATADPRNLVRIIAVRRHSQYDSPAGTTNNDVALLKLATPLTFSSTVQPMCLPSVDPLDVSKAANIDSATRKKAAVVAGYGHMQEGGSERGYGNDPKVGSGSDTLNQVFVDLQSQPDCTNALSRSGMYFDKKAMICAGFPEGGKDSCQGDSGGPLLHKLKGGQWEIIGVVSFGAGCARAGLPGVYANVRNFIPWIQQNMY